VEFAQAKDNACGQAKIVLALHGDRRVYICGAQVISGDADREGPHNGAFDPSPESIGWPCYPSMYVFGPRHGDSAVNESGADQRVHEDLRFFVFKQMKHGAGKES
jgi:hypothetical protein